MKLEKLSGEVLLAETKRLVAEERRIGVEILNYLREIHRRRLFAERGYSSMHEFCIKDLGYSEGAAHRRLSTLRVSNEVPATEEALRDGRVNFTTVATLHGFLQQEKRENQKTYTKEEKQDLLKAIEGKSKASCEKLFATMSPRPAPQDQAKPLSENLTYLQFAVRDRILKKLERIRTLTSHQHAHSTYEQLLEYMADHVLADIDPELKMETRKPDQNRTTSPERNSRYIKRLNIRELWRRSGGQCEYRDPKTGRRCESRYKLQKDHLDPHACGGSNSLENLRLVCPTHNQLAAIQAFGFHKMKKYIQNVS